MVIIMVKKSYNRKDIMNAIKKTVTELGKNPSRSTFIRYTGIAEYHVLKHFSSWNSAVEAAGFEPDTSNIRLEDDDLLSDWGKIVRKLRQIPTRVQYKHIGKYSSWVFEKHFGLWSNLPDKFRTFAKDSDEWNDVITLLPLQQSSNGVNKSVSDISKFETDIEHISKSPYHVQKHNKLNDRLVYGNPIDFRGLRHEPTNENGVIFLFGMVARELGYAVESVQSGFPDCEAKRQIGKDRWQPVRIEFEHKSKNFFVHGHDPYGADIIVYWEHNWDECPIEVIELKKSDRKA